jgi:amidophosphoribosyltransferase
MKDFLTHQSGVAFVRLRKPLAYFQEKYGSVLYGFHKLFLLMEKQHNRGQDAAGIGAVKLNVPAGRPYIFRDRLFAPDAINTLFSQKREQFQSILDDFKLNPYEAEPIKQHFDYAAELMLGHVSYTHYASSTALTSKETCHPHSRKSTWPTRNLMIAGNFHFTNIDAINRKLVERGQHPISSADTQTILEEIGYQLDEEHSRLFRMLRDSQVPRENIPAMISQKLDLLHILKKATRGWDGGFVLSGLLGSGHGFVMRDPNGIRPAFFYQDDEIVAAASERPALLTAFDLDASKIHELRPGHALIVQADGTLTEQPYAESVPVRKCSFERIYFSRGNDPEIYSERKALGASLASSIMEAVGNDLKHTVFSFIPNTAEVAYMGLLNEIHQRGLNTLKADLLSEYKDKLLTEDALSKRLTQIYPRAEKMVLKDNKLRDFSIEQDPAHRLSSHFYDITYGVITPKDMLVCLDDSILRGHTLRESILRILSRTRPKKIIVASTAPQARYPDCYGINMGRLQDLIAFQALIVLLKETFQDHLLESVYQDCIAQATKPPADQVNHIKRLYKAVSLEALTKKIAELAYPETDSSVELELIFQSIETLHQALPMHKGDWYFTGEYPTAGGNAFITRAFIEYYQSTRPKG